MFKAIGGIGVAALLPIGEDPMVLKAGTERGRNVARLWFRGVEADISQLTYADLRRGILQGYCIDNKGAKHGTYEMAALDHVNTSTRQLQQFEARGHIRVEFKAENEPLHPRQPAIQFNLYRMGVGVAAVLAEPA
jgi:hypothetical protein